MGSYSIKQLEALSGIKAHTLRIWEKRYNLFAPSRTEGNQRIYGDEELRKLLNIAFVYNCGIKPSEIAKLEDEHLDQKVLELEQKTTTPQIEQAILAIQNFDEWKFQQIVNNQISLHGFEYILFDFILAFLERVGILWQTRGITPAHEHFASNLIRQKIITVIDQMEPASITEKRCILFLPEGEIHELGLMIAHYLLKKRGLHCLYLGATVPLNDLLTLAKGYKPDFFIGSITSDISLNIPQYLHELKNVIPVEKTYLIGRLTRDTEFSAASGFKTFESIDEMVKAVVSQTYLS